MLQRQGVGRQRRNRNLKNRSVLGASEPHLEPTSSFYVHRAKTRKAAVNNPLAGILLYALLRALERAVLRFAAGQAAKPEYQE